MKILIVTNHFNPEFFRVNDIASELVVRGHDVKVLTAIPDYPQGSFYKGYGFLRRRCEVLPSGVQVVRFAVIPRGNGHVLGMILNYASSFVCSIFHGLWQGFFHKYDCIFVHDTSPAFISIPAIIAGCLCHAPVIHWLLDMWPESLVAGGINSSMIHSIVGYMMKRIYRQDDQILIGSRGFRKLLVERGVPDDKITHLPNWSDIPSLSQHINDSLPVLPEGFNILFAGNLGEAQNLENMLAAAKMTSDTGADINWIFVGDGRKKVWIDDYVRVNGLGNHVFLLGRFPFEAMPDLFEMADILTVSMTSSKIFSITLPAKIQAYMAAGKPILAVLEGEGRDTMEDASCGICVPPDDIKGIADAALMFSSMDCDQLKEMGRNAKYYYDSNFSRQLCMDKLENCLYDALKRNLKS